MEMLNAKRQPDEKFKAELQVLGESVKHHVKEEETKVFAIAREYLTVAELEQIGEAWEKAKARKTSERGSNDSSNGYEFEPRRPTLGGGSPRKRSDPSLSRPPRSASTCSIIRKAMSTMHRGGLRAGSSPRPSSTHLAKSRGSARRSCGHDRLLVPPTRSPAPLALGYIAAQFIVGLAATWHCGVHSLGHPCWH